MTLTPSAVMLVASFTGVMFVICRVAGVVPVTVKDEAWLSRWCWGAITVLGPAGSEFLGLLMVIAPVCEL